ncbi:MAG: hypothetical protein L6R40_000298 [Gallowayella cf. fulva]|nr:MAG: hypothetical protein L6R40_000298 [Xanthomendoza cf. fulva]
MDRFFRLARRELYPDTPGYLRLRISPSAAFRQEGKLLLPIKESKDSYTKLAENGKSHEDIWARRIVGKWLRPEEDIWAIKVFDSIRVYGGLPGSVTAHKAEHWDTSALRSTVSDDSKDEGWNVPPQSLMDELANISLKLLNIDPRMSEEGIVLHTRRERPGEWLRWEASMSFNDFMLEILYKIDDDVIAIYPGFYEEPDNGKGLELEQYETAKSMRDVERKKVATAKDAGKAMEIFTKPRTTLPTFNKRYNNLGHLMIDQPQTTWNPEGTHLEQAPSYAFTAPRYSASDMGLLAQRLRHAEEEVLMREESCRVCEETFMKRSNGKDLDRTADIRKHYRSHLVARPRPCPKEDCQENLDDRDQYPAWADVVKHISEHGETRTCTFPGCHCPLWLLTDEQVLEHTSLHPELSDLRAWAPWRHVKHKQESATQTNVDDLDYDGRYKPRSQDSLTEKPDATTRLLCNNSSCLADLRGLTDTTDSTVSQELEEHARNCNTSVDAFERLNIRKTNTIMGPLTVIESKQKPTTRQRGNRGLARQTPAVSAETVSAPKSPRTRGKGKPKPDPANESSGKVATAQEAATQGSTAGDKCAPTDDKTAKEAKFVSMLRQAQSAKASTTPRSRTTRARSVPPQFTEADEAPTPSQLISGKRVNASVHQGKERQAGQIPPPQKTSDLRSSRRARSDKDVTDASKRAEIPASTKEGTELPVDEEEPEAPPPKKGRTARKTKADTKAADAGNDDKAPTARTARPKKNQTAPKTTQAAAGEVSAEPVTSGPSAAVANAPPKQPSRKRGATKVKFEDDQTQADAIAPEKPSRPVRQPRTIKGTPSQQPKTQPGPSKTDENDDPNPHRRRRDTPSNRNHAKEENKRKSNRRHHNAQKTRRSSINRLKRLTRKETQTLPSSLEPPLEEGADTNNDITEASPAKGKGKGRAKAAAKAPTAASTRKRKAPAKKLATIPEEAETATAPEQPATEEGVEEGIEQSESPGRGKRKRTPTPKARGGRKK